jgi:hypothetical protein
VRIAEMQRLKQARRGAWARVTIDRLRQLALQTLKGHGAATKIFSTAQVARPGQPKDGDEFVVALLAETSAEWQISAQVCEGSFPLPSHLTLSSYDKPSIPCMEGYMVDKRGYTR